MNKRIFCTSLLCMLTLNTLSASSEIDEKLDILSRESETLTTFTLPNGLQVILKPDRSAPVVSVQFWVGTGSIHEEQYTGSGISHAVEHMIFKGTPDLPAGDLSRIIQESGGRLNAYTTFDRTVYHADLPAEHWQVAFDLYADSIFNADFPEDEWMPERDVILREIAMGKDNPNRVLIRYLWQTAVRQAPYRHPVIGYTDTFSKLTRDDLVTFHDRHYTPCNTTLIIVGDINVAKVRTHVTETLARIPRPPRAPVILPEEPRQATPRIARFSAPHNITRMAQMWPVPKFPDEDAAALQVLAHIAGRGRTSRLHRTLVEDEGIVLGISAWYFDRGFWGISTQMEPENEAKALEAIDREMIALRDSTFTQAEVDRAIRSMVTQTIRSFTTMNGQAAHYGRHHLQTGNPASDRILLEQIANVTPEDVARVANQWFQTNTRNLVVVAPEELEFDAVTTVPTPPSKIERIELSNGVTLLMRPNPRLPFIYVATSSSGGLLSENREQAGITALMAELLTRGTQSRTRDEIAETIESRGASLSAYSGFNAFGLRAQALSSDAKVLLELVSDLIINPVFPENEFERQRTRQLAAIRQAQEEPRTQAMQQMRNMLFDEHPYQFMPNGTEETLANLTREQLQLHHANLVTSSNLVVAIFGDFDPETIKPFLEEQLARVKVAPVPEIRHARPRFHDTPQRDEQRAPRQQAIVITGFPGIDIFDDDVIALQVLQTALSGMSSQLFREVREKRGLAYFTGASQQTGTHPGFFALFAGTEPDATEEVDTLMQAEIERVREQGITQSEFDRARAQLLAQYDMQQQDQSAVAMDAALNERLGLGANYASERQERIRNMSPEAIHEAAKRIFRDQSRVTAVLLPESTSSDPGTVDE